jgi:hypothetical protein
VTQIITLANYSQQVTKGDRAATPGRKPTLNDLFDYLVGAGEQLRGHREVKHRGGLGIDYQLKLARLHNRQVRRFSALENTADI